MTLYFRYSSSLGESLNRFNVLTAGLGLPRIIAKPTEEQTLFDFYRQCTYFACQPTRFWVTKMHINEIGVIILFQAPGVVLKLHHHPVKQYSYLDLRLQPARAPRVWQLFSLNLYNHLENPRERGWLFRRLRRYPTPWYAQHCRTWLPSFCRPQTTCPLPVSAD